jgi:mannose-6-phosphate isomerase-like protein (cupin superfamily)
MESLVIRPDPAAEFQTEERCHILELSNSGLDPSVSIARARVEPGVTTARHRLNGVDERYVILNGSGRVEIDGRPPTAVAPGDVVLIPAGTGQRISNPGTEDLVFLCICTPPWDDACYEDVEGGAG